MDIKEELRKRGYAPGEYFNKCGTCGEMFVGDKRAWCCFSCATEQVGNVAKPDACPQLCEVTELIIDAVNIDGAHHKQWYLEQIAVKLGIELPEHEKGIIP
jgi:hypothetical protein